MGQQENEPLITPQLQQQPVYGFQPTFDPYQPQSQGYVYPQQPQYGYSNANVVVSEEYHSDSSNRDNHLTGSLIVLIVGIFFTPIWLLGLMYIRSHNKTARILGITSICLFAVCVIIIIIPIIIVLSR